MLFTFASFAPLLRADPPPSTQPDLSQLRQQIDQLADPDPDVRDSAAEQLMGLTRAQLPSLRMAALDERPLLPVQLASLHDIVGHVYLTAEPYKPLRNVGFMGLSWQPEKSGAISPPVVADRIQGFDAYRALRNGDVILKLLDNPDSPLLNSRQITEIVRVLGPGRTLRFQVLRSGRLVDVSVRLQARPLDLPDFAEEVNEWLRPRAEKADKYWQANFSLLDRDAATTDAASASAP